MPCGLSPAAALSPTPLCICRRTIPCNDCSLFDQFEMNLVTAGGIGALFGLMNLFSRASGGMLSDLAAARWGMRGRLWTLFIIQLLAGAFCLVLGKVDYTLGGTIAVMIIFSIFCQQAVRRGFTPCTGLQQVISDSTQAD